jgi:hypothetical protein
MICHFFITFAKNIIKMKTFNIAFAIFIFLLFIFIAAAVDSVIAMVALIFLIVLDLAINLLIYLLEKFL